jgi:hypothetical protein
MTQNDQRIFRQDALRRYARGRNQAVLPRLATPRAIAYLWLLLALLVAATLALWLTFVR